MGKRGKLDWDQAMLESGHRQTESRNKKWASRLRTSTKNKNTIDSITREQVKGFKFMIFEDFKWTLGCIRTRKHRSLQWVWPLRWWWRRCCKIIHSSFRILWFNQKGGKKSLWYCWLGYETTITPITAWNSFIWLFYMPFYTLFYLNLLSRSSHFHLSYFQFSNTLHFPQWDRLFYTQSPNKIYIL